MAQNIPHVLILGGGFGGLAASNEIRQQLNSSQVKITVVDKKNWFMVGFAKLWIIRGTRTFENSIGSLEQLSKKDINFIQEEILRIDLQSKFVKTTNQNISYDYLIIAMGAALAPEKIKGLKENSLNLYDHDQLAKIHDSLSEIKSGNIAIAITAMPYKCPPAPFEASLLIDSLLREKNIRENVKIHFYSPAPITLPAAGPEVSQQILDLIKSENITFHDSCKIKSVEKNKLIFENGEASFDVLIAVPPHIAPKVIYEAGLAKEGGFIPITRDCKTSFENVFAVGDVTSLPVAEKAVPKAGIFAEGEAITVAKNIISKIQNEKSSELFDGKGGCFIESGRDTASLIEVNMFTEPNPTTKITESTKKHLDEKLQFEKERLEKWL